MHPIHPDVNFWKQPELFVDRTPSKATKNECRPITELKRLQEEEERMHCPHLIGLTGYCANLEEHGSDQHDRAAESKDDKAVARLLNGSRSGSSRRTVRRGRPSG